MKEPIDSLHRSGLVYAQNNDMYKAIECFKQALTLAPTEPRLHNNLGNAYKKIQRWEEALFHYQQALRYQPHYAPAHHNMGTIYALQQQTQRALKHYRLAVHAAPDFWAAHYHLGLLLLKMQHREGAQKQFQNVIALHPEHIDAHFYLGTLALDNNELEEAHAAFQTVLVQNKEHIEALINLGVIALKRDQGQIAIDYFTKALAFDNDHLTARHNLAATFIHHDRFENALAHYEILLERAPEEPEYLYNAGVAQMALGHLAKAQKLFETLLTIQQHVAGIVNLAAIHIRQEHHAIAIPLLQQAARLQPDDETIHFMLQALTQEQVQANACPRYVSNLFNNYASYYDSHMQTSLNYKLPQQIGRLLHQLCPHPLSRALDLGCGTGLCGSVLREMSAYVVGVDIAPKMLTEARRKEVYDELHEADLLDFLENSSDCYNLAIAADVLPYLGELVNFFTRIQKKLTCEGILLFTHEISHNAPWQLQSNARFQHHPDYVEIAFSSANLICLHRETVFGRTQANQPVEMMLYALKRPNAETEGA